MLGRLVLKSATAFTLKQPYHNKMLSTSIPDIQRTNLAHTILMLKAMGINDLLSFDFIDPSPVH